MLTLASLPANHGDCLWIDYGDDDGRHRLLIDGGTSGTAGEILGRLGASQDEPYAFDLLVVSHVDADHIAGVLKLLDEYRARVTFGDIWFNGWDHLLPEGLEEQGPVQGEKLSDILARPDMPWNRRFDGDRIAVTTPGAPVEVPPGSGMRLTLLSPTPEKLHKLRPKWKKEVEKAGLAPGVGPAPPEEVPLPEGIESFGDTTPDVRKLLTVAYEADTSPANGSSIAMLAEYDGQALLLAGDAHAEVLIPALEALRAERGVDRVKLDLFKLPHHGSAANINRELLELVDCSHYLFSTSGAYFHHPDQAAVARVIEYGGQDPVLCFNYRSDESAVWDDRGLKLRHRYRTMYPTGDEDGLLMSFPMT